MTSNADYEDGWQAGYDAAVKEIQQQFMPLWRSVQATFGQSYRVDLFITNRRRMNREIQGHDHERR